LFFFFRENTKPKEMGDAGEAAVAAEQSAKKKPWWAIDKAAWKERLSGFYRLASIADGRDKPLPRWSDSDVEDFINSDPVYGPQVNPPFPLILMSCRKPYLFLMGQESIVLNLVFLWHGVFGLCP
jgi:hypothetical protein